MLVAGGAGFIGSHLVDALLAQGHDVACVDNFFIGTRANIAHLDGAARFKLYESDISVLSDLRDIIEAEKPDYVFHLAANSDIKASSESPEVELANTLMTTCNLLLCARKFGVKRFFFASTSAVYGERIGERTSEDVGQLMPISYYGASKLGSEAQIAAFAHMNDMDALILRFPNVIGERLTHGVIFDFINKLRNDSSELEILGDGTQCKPYLHVRDLINGIMLLKDSVKGVDIYNIGVNTATTVSEIADIVCKRLGLSDVRYRYTGGKIGWKGDVPSFDLDLTKIHAAGWSASMSSTQAVDAAVRAACEMY